MAKSEFPLSKNHSFRLGTGWDWCVHELSSNETPMRLLIAYHAGKHEYLAWLALVSDTDQGLIARLEYHASHLGWHVHLKPNNLDQLSWGVVKQSGERLKDCASEREPIAGKGEATALAFQIFNVQQEAWGMA
ncbi:hypothetical protein [Rhizorhabdus argentea]|uniref:hypothetical protein n=1 Tax=Rhizorhabdus argentea TaxID=1387174 RepID=UPI0030EDE4B0